ncbi:MAG: HNH endonuclease, partial [Niameybacter sp.]
MYLFNPITCQKTSTDYITLEGITGISKGNLSCYKTRKQMIRNLQCYLVEDNATYSELYSFMEKQKPEMEVWKDIEDSTWQISSYGRARYMSSKGYRLAIPQLLMKRLVYIIRQDGKLSTYGVARLVSKYFMKQPRETNLLLLHKDDNRWNCRVENLEWVSKSYMGKRYGGLANGIPVI